MNTELHTPRLLLRPFQPRDVDDALEYRNDPEFVRFLRHIPSPFTREDAERFVQTNMSEPWDRSPTFAVVLQGRVIGTVNFEVNAEARSAMIGYATGRNWWGQGLASEAASAAVEWVVEVHGLTRIWASTDVRNFRSRRLMEKLGMSQEAIRRQIISGVNMSRSTKSSMRSPSAIRGSVRPAWAPPRNGRASGDGPSPDLAFAEGRNRVGFDVQRSVFGKS